MGDVRIPAFATLLAAVIAVAGSIYVVWRNGRQQLRLQQREFADRAASRDAKWAEERRRAARAAEVDACVRFDAAVVLALAKMRRMADLVGRPGVRRKLFGRRWAQQWNRDVTDAAADLALPHSTVRLSARPAIREAVDAVASSFDAAATAVGSLPTYLPEPLLVGPVISAWRARVAAAIAEVQDARRQLASVLEESPEEGPVQPSLDSKAARS
ncbi:MAG: hypothetical protein M3Q47_15145 [Actinomycetota bacterium]|nr:hypothetical protein [Actinomycetota bacterium]